MFLAGSCVIYNGKRGMLVCVYYQRIITNKKYFACVAVKDDDDTVKLSLVPLRSDRGLQQNQLRPVVPHAVAAGILLPADWQQKVAKLIEVTHATGVELHACPRIENQRISGRKRKSPPPELYTEYISRKPVSKSRSSRTRSSSSRSKNKTAALATKVTRLEKEMNGIRSTNKELKRSIRNLKSKKAKGTSGVPTPLPQTPQERQYSLGEMADFKNFFDVKQKDLNMFAIAQGLLDKLK